jgi:hypothetical protein
LAGSIPAQIGQDPAWSPDDATLALRGAISGRKSGVIALTLSNGAAQMLATGGSYPDWRRF